MRPVDASWLRTSEMSSKERLGVFREDLYYRLHVARRGRASARRKELKAKRRSAKLAYMPRLLLRRLALILGAAGTFATLTGCATSDSDLNYSREQATPASGDHSYHGWNDANY